MIPAQSILASLAVPLVILYSARLRSPEVDAESL